MAAITLLPPIQESRIRFKNILFATDLSEASTEAQTYALLLAQMFGAHLFVLHVQPSTELLLERQQASLESAEKKTAESGVNRLEEFFRSSGVPVTLMVQRGDFHSALNKVAEEQFIDLIILGSHGRQGVSYLLQGSVAENVIRSCACPVMTLGPHAQGVSGNSNKTIIYITDFSKESKLALPYATSLAQEFHADLVVCHVAPKAERLARDCDRIETYLLNRLKKLVPQSRFPWCKVSYSVTFGDSSREILDIAVAQKGNLIVLGVHNAVQFTSHLPERLSYKILCEATCPVLSILPGRAIGSSMKGRAPMSQESE